MSGKPETYIEARRKMILAAENLALSAQEGDCLYRDDYEATPIHEAGHAVAAAVLGLSFDHLSIIPDYEGNSDGRIAFHRPCYEWLHGYSQSGTVGGIPLALKGCICLMAGPAAQLRWSNEDVDLRSSGKVDRHLLEFLSILIQARVNPRADSSSTMNGSNAIQHWAWREACLMIAKPRVWKAIERLSLHLWQHETASEPEVIKIVREADACYQPKLLHL